MAGQAVKHDYHLVDPSPWPAVGSLSRLHLGLGLCDLRQGPVRLARRHALGARSSAFVGVAYTMIGWWSDVVKESRMVVTTHPWSSLACVTV